MKNSKILLSFLLLFSVSVFAQKTGKDGISKTALWLGGCGFGESIGNYAYQYPS